MSFALSAAQISVSTSPSRTYSRTQQRHREYDRQQLALLCMVCPAQGPQRFHLLAKREADRVVDA